MDDDAFLRQFEDCSLPIEHWHHRQHIKIAYLYLCRFPLEAAIERVCGGIKRYNAAHQIPETIDRGYHETITQAWLRLINFTLCQYGPAANADKFFDDHPELWQFKVLRFFYSYDHLMSAAAKASFVEPDIISFPTARMAHMKSINSKPQIAIP